MSAVARQLLSQREARALTDEVKRAGEDLWRKLNRLYEGEAWTALNYGSWREYWIAEFGEKSLWLSYKQIAAGAVARELDALEDLPKPNQDQAIALAPLRKRPERLRETWAEVVELHPEPTAKQVREVVARRVDSPKRVETPLVVRAVQELYEAIQASPIEEVVAWKGDKRKLAMQWACVQSYLNDMHRLSKTPVPKVLKGEVYGYRDKA